MNPERRSSFQKALSAARPLVFAGVADDMSNSFFRVILMGFE